MRDANTCSASSGCGSPIDSSKRFCLRGTTTCPPNALLTYLKNMTEYTPTMTPLSSDYFSSFNYTNATNSPISGLRFAISRPCADLSRNYVKRPFASLKLLKNEEPECFMDDNRRQHELFYPTTYNSSELTVYKENNLTSKIKDKIPDYNEKSLTLNNYYLYYRTYPKWDV
jgi:hypothetical protein